MIWVYLGAAIYLLLTLFVIYINYRYLRMCTGEPIGLTEAGCLLALVVLWPLQIVCNGIAAMHDEWQAARLIDYIRRQRRDADAEWYRANAEVQRRLKELSNELFK